MKPEYLRELADIADPDGLWRQSAVDQIALPVAQRQQLDTGVALRRYAEHMRRVEAASMTGCSLLVTKLGPSAYQSREFQYWVSMDDRPPPPDTKLLVVWACGDEYRVDKAHTFTKWEHPGHPLGYLIQGHPGSHAMVTHWMLEPPLPYIPKRDKEPK